MGFNRSINGWHTLSGILWMAGFLIMLFAKIRGSDTHWWFVLFPIWFPVTAVIVMCIIDSIRRNH